MNILQINVVYDTGSTGKIMCSIHKELFQNGDKSVICYGRGKKTSDQNVHKVSYEWYSKLNKLISKFTGIMYGGCYFSTKRTIKIIKESKPDVVHLHCINGNFVNIFNLLKFLKKHNINTVLTLHAEFMYTANCTYAMECEKWKSGCEHCEKYRYETGSLFFDNTKKSWEKMRDSFDNFENLVVVSVSPWLGKRALESPFFKGRNQMVILNGVDTDIFNPSQEEKSISLKKNYKKTIFHVTSFFSDDINHIKGGWYVLELAKRLSDYLFVVAGKFDSQISVPENVVLLGNVSDQKDLASYYSDADLTLLTSRKETFSMVVAESLCCGTPIAGFFAGAPEMITIDDYSKFVEYGNLEELEAAIKELANKNFTKEEIFLKAKEKYDINKMTENYISLYKEITEA